MAHLSLTLTDNQGLEYEPEFQGSISNVTYPAGREAILTCTVKNLGKYKVSTMAPGSRKLQFSVNTKILEIQIRNKIYMHNGFVSILFPLFC